MYLKKIRKMMPKNIWFNGLYSLFENLFKHTWNVRNNLLSLQQIN